MSDSVQSRVLKVIATTRRLPLESVTPDSTFEELGVDSLDRLNILFDLEGEFDIEIDDEEAKKVTSIREMIAGVTQLIEAKAAGGAGVEPGGDSPAPTSVPPTLPLATAAPLAPEAVPPTPLDPAVLPAPLHDLSETED